MRGDRPAPASAGEAAAARAFAEALEGRGGTGADPEALAVARLLASLREEPGDELAARRGALRLAAATRAAVRRRALRRLAAPLAAALVLAAALAGRRAAGPAVSDELLARREAAAREALAGIVSGPEEAAAERARSLLSRLATSRFDELRRRWTAERAGAGATSVAADAGGKS